MADALQTYLHDHMAGAKFAVELLRTLVDEYQTQPIGRFAAGILHDVTADRQTLQEVLDQVGEENFNLKEAVAWLGERVSRVKLKDNEPHGIGIFQALETLSLGILGKLALWRVLPLIAAFDSRIPSLDFEALAGRAKDQFNKIEEYRLSLASKAFAVPTTA